MATTTAPQPTMESATSLARLDAFQQTVNHYYRLTSQIASLTLQVDSLNASLFHAAQSDADLDIACLYKTHVKICILEGVRDMYVKYADQVANHVAEMQVDLVEDSRRTDAGLEVMESFLEELISV